MSNLYTCPPPSLAQCPPRVTEELTTQNLGDSTATVTSRKEIGHDSIDSHNETIICVDIDTRESNDDENDDTVFPGDKTETSNDSEGSTSQNIFHSDGSAHRPAEDTRTSDRCEDVTAETTIHIHCEPSNVGFDTDTGQSDSNKINPRCSDSSEDSISENYINMNTLPPATQLDVKNVEPGKDQSTSLGINTPIQAPHSLPEINKASKCLAYSPYGVPPKSSRKIEVLRADDPEMVKEKLNVFSLYHIPSPAKRKTSISSNYDTPPSRQGSCKSNYDTPPSRKGSSKSNYHTPPSRQGSSKSASKALYDNPPPKSRQGSSRSASPALYDIPPARSRHGSSRSASPALYDIPAQGSAAPLYDIPQKTSSGSD